MKLIKNWNRAILGRMLVALLLLTWVGGSINVLQASASSATITFSSKTPEVKKGDSFSVVLTITSSATIGDFEAYVSYDSDIMEFQSGGSFISGGDGLLRISDLNTEISDTTKKYSMKFKAVDVGACEVGISDTAIVYDYDQGTEMSVSSNRLSVTVASSEKLSKNNALESLKISPGTLQPEFDPKVAEYAAQVSSDTDKLFVSGIPAQMDATVSVTGNDNLKSGDNTVTITVKAPSGDKKEYKIVVKKDEASVIPESSTSPSPDGAIQEEDGFSVYTKEGNTYIQNTYEYQIMDVLDEGEVPAGYVKTTLILYGVTVDAYTLKDDLDNDFLLIYAMNQNGDIGFYQYDRVEKTLQRYTGSVISGTDNNTSGGAIQSLDEYNSKVQQLSVIIAVLSALSAFLLIIVIRFYFKTKGYHDDDL